MKEVMKMCGLDEEVAEMYPFQLSGGMARRVFDIDGFYGGQETCCRR